ncbi:putative lipoprotein [Rhizobium sp. PP-F2F-G20b]|nr:putative lipoprotein [Rhizobium sp. PP-F2F-G20b]
MTFRTAALTALLLTATVLTASGCGRKGDLERPSVARAQAAKEAGNTTRAPSAAPSALVRPASGAAPASSAVTGNASSQTTAVTQMNVVPGSDNAAARSGRTGDQTDVPERPFLLDPLL